MHLGSGSVVPSRTGFTPTGSPRPSRPGQIDPGLIEGIAGGADPSVVSEMSHASAAACSTACITPLIRRLWNGC